MIALLARMRGLRFYLSSNQIGVGVLEAVNSRILRLGVTWVLWCQYASPLADWPALLVTSLGSQIALLALVAWIIWRTDHSFGVRLALVLVLSGAGNALLKGLFLGPRPFRYDPRVRLIGPGPLSGGLPSGHAQVTTTLWSILARRFDRRWLTRLSVAVVVLVGVSRVYLGVHFPHDVIVGTAIGWLTALWFGRYLVTSVRPVDMRLDSKPVEEIAVLSRQTGLVFTVLAPVLILSVMIDIAGLDLRFATVSLPLWWQLRLSNESLQRAGRVILATAAAIAGLLGGDRIWHCRPRRACLDIRRFGPRAIAGFVGGQVGLAVIYLGLWPFAHLTVLRYLLVGIWLTGIWPTIAEAYFRVRPTAV